MFRRATTVVLLLTFAACSASEDSPRDVAVPNFSCVEGFYAVRLPPKLTDLRRMGKLEREENGRPGAGPGWEEYRVLHFRNLNVAVTVNPSSGTYALEGVEVTGPEWKISGGLQVGLPGAEILQPLGVKRPADGVWRLWQPGPEEEKIAVVGGRIASVSYSCYTG